MNLPIKELPNDCLEALEHGRLIDAIKLLRHSRNIGLKEAKEAIDLYLKENPGIKERYTTAQVSSNHYGAWILIVLGFVSVFAYLALVN